MKQDVYKKVTDSIVEALEKGVRPWMQPWNAAHAAGKISRPLRHNGLPYSGVNVLMLWLEATAKGYTAPIWMTYNQAKELGGHVRYGERGSLVVYANTFIKTEPNKETGEDEDHEIPYMKPYTVFNVEQIEGLPAHYYAKASPPTLTVEHRHAAAEQFFKATGADIRHNGNRAFYAIGEDYIQMPPFEFFKDPESYYAVLSHESTHWTRHPSRLDRDLGRKQWGDAGYAMEELVAEIGSAFLCAELGITPELREDHAAYIENWLTVLKGDRRAIFTAASHAQKAADFLLNLHPAPPTAPEPEPAPRLEQEQPDAPSAPEPPPPNDPSGERPAAPSRPPVTHPAGKASRPKKTPKTDIQGSLFPS